MSTVSWKQGVDGVTGSGIFELEDDGRFVIRGATGSGHQVDLVDKTGHVALTGDFTNSHAALPSTHLAGWRSLVPDAGLAVFLSTAREPYCRGSSRRSG